MTPMALRAPTPALRDRATGRGAPLSTPRSSSGRSLGNSHPLLLEISRVCSLSLRR